jgi:hypothetical protein
MTIAARRPPASSLRLSPVAWTPVLVLAATTSLGLLALAGRYGYHRDELYFRVLARAPGVGLRGPTGVANEEEGTVVRICRGPRRPWSQLWPEFRHVGLSTFCEPCRRLDLTGG